MTQTRIPPAVAEHALAECERLQARVAELEEICQAVEMAIRICLPRELAPYDTAWRPLADAIRAALAKGEK